MSGSAKPDPACSNYQLFGTKLALGRPMKPFFTTRYYT